MLTQIEQFSGPARRRQIVHVVCAHFSGGASAVKEPRHFEVRKSSSQFTRMHFFPQKVDDLFLVVALKTGRQSRFTVKIKQIKRSDMVAFLPRCM